MQVNTVPLNTLLGDDFQAIVAIPPPMNSTPLLTVYVVHLPIRPAVDHKHRE